MENEDKKEPGEKSTRYIITKEMFDHLYEMLRHEDEKANRILSAMAFITLAAAALAIPFFEGSIGADLEFFHFSLGVFLFFLM